MCNIRETWLDCGQATCNKLENNNKKKAVAKHFLLSYCDNSFTLIYYFIMHWQKHVCCFVKIMESYKETLL